MSWGKVYRVGKSVGLHCPAELLKYVDSKRPDAREVAIMLAVFNSGMSVDAIYERLILA